MVEPTSNGNEPFVRVGGFADTKISHTFINIYIIGIHDLKLGYVIYW